MRKNPETIPLELKDFLVLLLSYEGVDKSYLEEIISNINALEKVGLRNKI